MTRFPYDEDMTHIAQALRNSTTPEENHLWYDFLRHYPVQFRRQKPFHRFVLDFYCAKAKLGIELDGSQHFSDEGIIRDANRTAILNELGIEILRFTNYDVNTHFDQVCAQIDKAVQSRL